ncbi:EF-P lysine aminoacylase EpmA [Methylomonas sp. AM2-LC]|uniref:EF-P lysine aminoacylase EpmA n=1 Tax=Methylomonas sp. AM2-LC TaxID=3153301 RepID=UPI003265B49B
MEQIVWQPACDQRHLRLRAQMLADIRMFFHKRDVLEVETPLLCATTGTDPQLDFFVTQLNAAPNYPHLYLQTSPEFAMKRLLAAGCGSIYQICKAFRNGESGRLHNPEFTLLEWYRLDYALPALMTEVAELLKVLLDKALPTLQIKHVTYQQLFHDATGLDALEFNLTRYQAFAQTRGYSEAADLCGKQPVLWLDFLFSHCVQPAMPQNTLLLVADYPSRLSSLARVSSKDQRLSERFEVFINGVELGNGYFELTDATEQSARFDQEIAYRHQQGLKTVEKDQRLLSALKAGLPDCSGVAIGLDRLLMFITESRHIDEVLAFPLNIA